MSDTESPPTRIIVPPFPDVAWRGVFKTYYDCIVDVSECPAAYHFPNLLAVISTVIGDTVRFAEGKALYGNFFLFCCGRTGTKKSTASDLVHDHIVTQLVDKPFLMLTSISSAEGLIRTLGQRPVVFLRYDEIKDLFTTASRSGQRIEPILNSAFDLREIQAIVKRQRDSLSATNYFFTLLMNGTQEHVQIDLSETFFKGGLLNRFLVFEATPTDKEMPQMGTPDPQQTLAVATQITELGNAWRAVALGRGGVVMDFSPSARLLHADWYRQYTRMMKELSSLRAHPLTRLDTFVKKLAMVFALIDVEPTPLPFIADEHLDAAIAVLRYCQASMSSIADVWSGPKTVGQQAEVLAEDRIEAYLKTHGCTDERTMYRTLHLSASESNRAVVALVKSGIVNVGWGRPTMIHFKKTCACFTEDHGDDSA